MYRLSNIRNDILQRVISNEMAAGFLRTFGVTRAVEHLDIGDFGKGIIKYLLNTYSVNDAFHDLGEAQLSEIGKKIEKMYEELLDPEYEYTYDEFGEYLLFIFIEHAKQNAYDVRESGYFVLDEHTEENYSEVPMFASTSLSIMDELYLREYFSQFYDSMIEDDEELEDEIDREEFINELVKQGSMFWCMGFDDVEEESFIFWDDDFLFFDEPGSANLFFMEEGKSLGFVMTEDDREPISGSLKWKMGEE